MQAHVSDTSLTVQLCADVLWEAVEDNSSVWAPANHVEDSKNASGFGPA